MVGKRHTKWFLVAAVVLMLALAGCQTGEIPSTGGTPAAGTVVPSSPAVAAAQAWLAQQLGVDVMSVEVLEAEQVDWSDSCLGLGGPAESCLQAITPGWQVVVNVNGDRYVLRTDETGTQVRQAEPVVTP